MSYPWWVFHVEFADGYATQYIATGLTPTDALHELTAPSAEDDFSLAVKAHGEPTVIESRGILEPDIPGPGVSKVVEVEELR